MKKKKTATYCVLSCVTKWKELREIDDDLKLRKKVAEMSRQRQTEELVSKEKLP